MAVVTACSGSATKPDDTTPSQPPDAAPVAVAPGTDAGAAAADAGPAEPVVTTPPTEDECLSLLDHMLRIQFSNFNEDKSEDQSLPEEDFAKIKRDLRGEFVPHCTSAFTRDAYNCSMKATTRAQWKACEGP